MSRNGRSSPLLLGFEEIERLIDRASKTAGDGYPPYNIERLPRNGSEPERLRITLAVAGFAREDLEVSFEENELVILGDGRRTKSSANISIAALPRGSFSAPSWWPTESRSKLRN